MEIPDNLFECEGEPAVAKRKRRCGCFHRQTRRSTALPKTVFLHIEAGTSLVVCAIAQMEFLCVAGSADEPVAEREALQDSRLLFFFSRHACMTVRKYSYMHVCMYACMHVCMCAYIHACIHVCMYACLHTCMYACVHLQGGGGRGVMHVVIQETKNIGSMRI